MKSEEYTEKVKIPKERVNVLIGTRGTTKRAIQAKTNTKIEIEEENIITIYGKNSIDLWSARDIVRAIGRGFSPEKALLIDGEKYAFETFDIKEYARNENDIQRLKGRVIGSNGKARIVIEKTTGAYISVYGKTVGIISPIEMIETVRRAVQMLLEGAMHKTVYKMIEKKRTEENKKAMEKLA